MIFNLVSSVSATSWVVSNHREVALETDGAKRDEKIIALIEEKHKKEAESAVCMVFEEFRSMFPIIVDETIAEWFAYMGDEEQELIESVQKLNEYPWSEVDVEIDHVKHDVKLQEMLRLYEVFRGIREGELFEKCFKEKLTELVKERLVLYREKMKED